VQQLTSPSIEVNLFGHFDGLAGTTIAARRTLLALEATGVRVMPCELAEESNRPASFRPSLAQGAVNLIQVNPRHVIRAFERVRSDPAGARPTLAIWVQDVPDVPQRLKDIAPLIDEVWTPSSFVANFFNSEVRASVQVIPHPAAPPDVEGNRDVLGLPADRFIFLFAFNARSNLIRKNPLDLVRAYRIAFPAENGESMLVLKTIMLRPFERAMIERVIGSRSDVLILDETVGDTHMAQLTAACDCYVSLHRAEGFGMGMAEAMCLERPVIATGYGGNVDFMPPGTGFLVDHILSTLDRDIGVFPAGTVWAEPDIAHAARLMRHVFTHREEARETGLRAAAYARPRLSYEHVGGMMRARLMRFAGRGNRTATAV
jgi:glycosyltransferase involved in cell wall biosynthesis